MKITFFLIAILFVATDSVDDDDYNDDDSYYKDNNPKDYSSEEEPEDLPDVTDRNDANGESQPNEVDINDIYLIRILDHIIDEINIKEDPIFE